MWNSILHDWLHPHVVAALLLQCSVTCNKKVHKWASWFNESFPSRSCWGQTLGCLVGCRAWCLLHLARCEGREGPTWIWNLLLTIQRGHSQGETERPGRREDLQFKKQKHQTLPQQHCIRLTPNIKLVNRIGGRDFSLTVSPYSQHHAETDSQEHSFCFLVLFFFLNKYQHK